MLDLLISTWAGQHPAAAAAAGAPSVAATFILN